MLRNYALQYYMRIFAHAPTHTYNSSSIQDKHTLSLYYDLNVRFYCYPACYLLRKMTFTMSLVVKKKKNVKFYLKYAVHKFFLLVGGW